jgi:hypothetical protein
MAEAGNNPVTLNYFMNFRRDQNPTANMPPSSCCRGSQYSHSTRLTFSKLSPGAQPDLLIQYNLSNTTAQAKRHRSKQTLHTDPISTSRNVTPTSASLVNRLLPTRYLPHDWGILSSNRSSKSWRWSWSGYPPDARSFPRTSFGRSCRCRWDNWFMLALGCVPIVIFCKSS